MTTWRAEVPAMLAWMTPRLAQAAVAEAAAHSPHPRPSGSAAPRHKRHHRRARKPRWRHSGAPFPAPADPRSR